MLGSNSAGSGGQILRCSRHCDGVEFAVKKIVKNLSAEGKSQISALQRLDHANIIKMVDWFEDDEHIFIVMELAAGGDLCDKIVNSGTFSEKVTTAIFCQILLAVNYIHSKGIVHCDIKPENILCMSSDDDATVKVTDFGFAQNDEGKDRHILQPRGTMTYCAPEVLGGEAFDSKADMWSLGVLLYCMLAGKAPFGQNQPRSQLLRKALKCQLDFSHDVFSAVSADAQDLIRRLVVVSPQDRLSAADALRHPWVAGGEGVGAGAAADGFNAA